MKAIFMGNIVGGSFYGCCLYIWQEKVKNHPVFIFEHNRIENSGTGRKLERDSVYE